MPSDWPLKHASQLIEREGIRWHVQIIGSGPPVLLLHGTGASTHSMADLAMALSDHYTCVLVDLPGHGFTTALPEREHLLPAMAMAVQSLCVDCGLIE